MDPIAPVLIVHVPRLVHVAPTVHVVLIATVDQVADVAAETTVDKLHVNVVLNVPVVHVALENHQVDHVTVAMLVQVHKVVNVLVHDRHLKLLVDKVVVAQDLQLIKTAINGYFNVTLALFHLLLAKQLLDVTTDQFSLK